MARAMFEIKEKPLRWRKKKKILVKKWDCVYKCALFVLAMYEPKTKIMRFKVFALGGPFGNGCIRCGKFSITDENRTGWRSVLLVKIISAVVFLYRDIYAGFDDPDLPVKDNGFVPFIHDLNEEDFAENKWS